MMGRSLPAPPTVCARAVLCRKGGAAAKLASASPDDLRKNLRVIAILVSPEIEPGPGARISPVPSGRSVSGVLAPFLLSLKLGRAEHEAEYFRGLRAHGRSG